MEKRRIAVLAGAAVAAAVCAVVFFCDPSGARWMPKCAFHAITGLQCPGCGFTRALHALLHGHPLEALRYNYFFVISIPVAAAVAYTTWSDGALARRLQPVAQGKAVILGYVGLFFVWWIVRNVIGV
ncbi:MAG: DUF2752 domain-containing protein [Clostridium sp.]|nr:DUF2752 domain-containing protein [Clostridium sp.]